MATLCRGERRLTTRARRCRWTAVGGVLAALVAISAHAQPAVRLVLVLQSVDRGNLVIDEFTNRFRTELDRLAGNPVNVLQVVVGPTGFVGAPEPAVVEFIRSTFADRPKPDLVMSVAGPASEFARKYRQQLFPGAPLLLAAVDRRYLDGRPLNGNEAAVPVANDFVGTVQGILNLLPQTKQIFMVSGSGQSGQFWRGELEEQFKPFGNRLNFIWSSDLSLSEILRRCASLPPDSAIFYLTFGTDAAGAAYADERVLADIHAAANAPLFGVQGPYLGYGVVGGSLMSIEDLARNAADVANRILRGAGPDGLTVSLQRPGQPVFDARELERWMIPESRLPPGSLVRFKPPTLWGEYRNIVLSGIAVLLVQSLLIVGLLYQRRARRRAELESRRHLTLAADASRRQTMAALTNSITHELGQPLSSLVHNAQALQMMVSSKRATAETISEVLSDIQAQGAQACQIIDRHRSMLRSRELSPKPTDLRAVVQDSLALVAHDLKLRDIETIVDLPAGPCVVNGDHVLLQQVVVNLVMNGMDAMAGTPPGKRRITVRGKDEGPDFRIFVGDSGTGLPEALDGKLFAPFVTTKAHGLGIGLTIVRTIVDAHGGALAAYNNPDGGATFAVTLRRSQPVPGGDV